MAHLSSRLHVDESQIETDFLRLCSPPLVTAPARKLAGEQVEWHAQQMVDVPPGSKAWELLGEVTDASIDKVAQ